MTSPPFQRILLIRPSALGDVCRTVPVLASLRSAHPDARIDWLVQDSFADAVAHHPALTSVVAFPRKTLGSQTSRGRFGPALAWMDSLRRARYDLVVDCQGLARSALFAWATRAPTRVGYANAQEFGWLAYTSRVRADRSMHAVDRMLALVESMGIPAARDMRLHVSDADRRAVANDTDIARRRFVLVAPTSRWPGKRWPADRFAAAAARLLSLGVERILLVASESERDQCRPLLDLASRDPRVIDRIGATTVARLMAYIQAADVVLSNDSAALHMAVGFDRPIVALFGPTRLDRVGPYRREADVIQHLRPDDDPDHKNEPAGTAIMSRITVDEVVDAVISRYRLNTTNPDADAPHA